MTYFSESMRTEVATHELGNGLGLGDRYSSNGGTTADIMWYAATRNNYLSQNDKDSYNKAKNTWY
jgi:hypothetical protein